MLMVALALPLSTALVFTLRTVTANENTVCDPREHLKPIEGEPNAYLQCVPSFAHLGDWTKQACPQGEEFSVLHQRCKPHSSIRRQQSLCQASPMSQSCQQQNCQASNANPYLGGQCSWASAGLQPYAGSSNQFLQCTPASTGSACGTWNQMQCTPGTVYNPSLQVCVSAGLQQQSSCQQNYNPVCPCGNNNACPQSCVCQINVCCQPPVTQIPPTYISPFITTPLPQLPYCRNGQRAISACSSNNQCQQGYYCENNGCCPLPLCPNGQPSVQVCYESYGGQGQSDCPDGTSCQNNACCYLPVCSNGLTPTQACYGSGQSSCMQGFTCESGACCQIPACPDGQAAMQACVGQGQSNCPQGYQCQNGACCSLPQCPNGQTAVQSCQTGGYGPGTCPQGYSCQNSGCCPLPMCQTGQPAIQTCSGMGQGGCPQDYTCQNSGCCPLPRCQSGQTAVQSCFGNGQSNCPQSYSCQNNGCCPLPSCPRGGTATQQCSGPGTCSSNQYCINGGCCPMPTCNNGQTAIQPCDQNPYCPQSYSCQNGGCCPMPPPMCPTGQQASSTCSGPGTCGSSQYCYVDNQGRQGCCSLPSCPDGNTAVQPCTGVQTGGGCPQNMQCVNMACCPLPRCPDGQPSVQSCANGGYCQQGMVCQNGACCPQPPPMCPTGQAAIQLCGPSGSCPYNYVCQNGGCCPMPPTTYRPSCPNGMPGIQSCSGYGQDCPYGYSCQNGQCCQSAITTPQPRCPDGQYPMQPCGMNNYCPNNYYCYNGQCCYQSQQYTTPQTCVCPPPTCQNCPQQPQNCQCPPVQPQQQCQNCCPITLQICQCAAYNNQCPTGSSCNSGACCASGTKKFNDEEGATTSNEFGSLRPGDGCTKDDQCPGYPATSKCVTGYCVCTGNSRSNGYSCVTYKRRLDPSEVCDQFGSECKYFDRHQRRRPPTSEELGITNETVPLYWHAINEGRCVTDKECTPDQMCIQNKCFPYLRPGDFNCKFDEQCNKTCAFSVCVKNTAANITMCQCENGRYEFAHKCWKECPAGTKPKGQICAAGKLETPKVKTFAKRLLSMFSPFQYSLNDDEDSKDS